MNDKEHCTKIEFSLKDMFNQHNSFIKLIYAQKLVEML